MCSQSMSRLVICNYLNTVYGRLITYAFLKIGSTVSFIDQDVEKSYAQQSWHTRDKTSEDKTSEVGVGGGVGGRVGVSWLRMWRQWR